MLESKGHVAIGVMSTLEAYAATWPGPKLLTMTIFGPMTPLQSKSASISEAPVTAEGNAEVQGLDPRRENWPCLIGELGHNP